jgi:Trypsin-co-occurring domain 1
MADKQLLKFSLEDGTPFYFEVESPPTSPGSQPISSPAEKVTLAAKESLDDALVVVAPVARKIVNRLRSGLTEDADEVEVKFGLKLSSQAGVVFAAAGAEVNFEVTMKWKKDIG